MAETIIDEMKWYGGYGRPLHLFNTPQQLPTPEELIAFGAEETGDTIEQQYNYNPEEDAPTDGRDIRTWAMASPCEQVFLTFVPDKWGWHVECLQGSRYRPTTLDDLKFLLEEMDHQYSRYGGLL